MTASLWHAIPLTVAVMLLAGFLRGYTGFGFSVAAVPLLSLVLTPDRAVPIVVVLQVIVSLNGLRPALRDCDARSVVWIGVGAVAITPLGALGLARLDPVALRLAMAAIVTALAIVVARSGATAPASPRRRPAPALLAIGLVSGVFNGLAGIPGPPVIAFYLRSGLPAPRARASMILVFLLTAAIAVASVAALGLVSGRLLLLSAVGVPAVLAGSTLGARLFARSHAAYRPVAVAVLLATALVTALKALV